MKIKNISKKKTLLINNTLLMLTIIKRLLFYRESDYLVHKKEEKINGILWTPSGNPPIKIYK